MSQRLTPPWAMADTADMAPVIPGHRWEDQSARYKIGGFKTWNINEIKYETTEITMKLPMFEDMDVG